MEKADLRSILRCYWACSWKKSRKNRENKRKYW